MEINNTFVDFVNSTNIAIPMYNLIEYSDNYSDSSGSLWSFKRDEINDKNDVKNDNNAPSAKYKSDIIIFNTENNGTKNRIKIAVLLKYLSNFWRSLEMPLINCKIELLLKWVEDYVLTTATIDANAGATSADSAIFKITDTKFYVHVVALSTEDNAKLTEQLSEGFKRSAYWNKYTITDNKIVEITTANEEKHIRELLDSSYQEVKRFFIPAYDNTVGYNKVSVDSSKKYFLPRVKIESYNIEIDGRNFYNQPINDSIIQYDELRKVSTEQGDDYTTGFLLNFAYFEKNYRLVAADLSKTLDADQRAIQEIIFTGKIKSTVANTRVIIYYILEQSKETILQFSKVTTNVL